MLVESLWPHYTKLIFWEVDNTCQLARVQVSSRAQRYGDKFRPHRPAGSHFNAHFLLINRVNTSNLPYTSPYSSRIKKKLFEYEMGRINRLQTCEECSKDARNGVCCNCVWVGW